MRIGIIGCEALKREIDRVTLGDQEIVFKEYLDFGLHLNTDGLKSAVLEHLQALDGRVDAIFLGFANCNVLKDVASKVQTPVVMIETDDCIAALLTPERYSKEKSCGQITWFYPIGWAASGPPGLIRIFHLDSAEGYSPEYFLKIMFDGFSRCLFIDTGVEDGKVSEENSQALAEVLNLKHERIEGTLSLIQQAWLNTKAKARELESMDGGAPATPCEVRPMSGLGWHSE